MAFSQIARIGRGTLPAAAGSSPGADPVNMHHKIAPSEKMSVR
jgi:hypothetical protein